MVTPTVARFLSEKTHLLLQHDCIYGYFVCFVYVLYSFEEHLNKINYGREVCECLMAQTRHEVVSPRGLGLPNIW